MRSWPARALACSGSTPVVGIAVRSPRTGSASATSSAAASAPRSRGRRHTSRPQRAKRSLRCCTAPAHGRARRSIRPPSHASTVGSRVSEATSTKATASRIPSALERIVRDGVVLAAAISEPGQDLTRPGTRATRTESGWRIDGRKAFCTMSPAATDLYVAVTYADGEGTERYAYAMVPADAPGVVVNDDWDALGMRASGSNSISLDGVELPESGVRGGFRAGDAVPYMERNLLAGLFHAAASLGIAEQADRLARQAIAGRINGDARPRTHVADNAVDLAAARAVLSRAGALIDEHRAANPASDGSAEQLGALFAEAQAAKAFVGEAATRVVDRALALSGGAGYRAGSPLARAYRDVKAGSFMHPLGANRAYDHLSRVALGQQTSLH